jgi:hypothetical protein
MEDHRVEEVYSSSKQLLHGDNIDIIIENAIKQGMMVRQDGKEIKSQDISDDDRYELMGHFIQFIVDHNKELDSRFIIAKA